MTTSDHLDPRLRADELSRSGVVGVTIRLDRQQHATSVLLSAPGDVVAARINALEPDAWPVKPRSTV